MSAFWGARSMRSTPTVTKEIKINYRELFKALGLTLAILLVGTGALFAILRLY